MGGGDFFKDKIMELIFKNRNGVEFTFEVNEEGNVNWIGNFGYYRVGLKDGKIVMIDPSGGPYIDVGSTLNEKLEINGVVSGFKEIEGGYKILIEPNED